MVDILKADAGFQYVAVCIIIFHRKILSKNTLKCNLKVQLALKNSQGTIDGWNGRQNQCFSFIWPQIPVLFTKNLAFHSSIFSAPLQLWAGPTRQIVSVLPILVIVVEFLKCGDRINYLFVADAIGNPYISFVIKGVAWREEQFKLLRRLTEPLSVWF